MSLEVKVTKGAISYLKCDVIDHSFTRMVTQTGLPAAGEGTAPPSDGVFLLDLGITIEAITLTGVVDDVPDDSSVSKGNMETVVRSWWAFGDTDSNLLKVSLPSVATVAQEYYGAIRTATFRKSAGILGRWEYSLSFLIKSKV